MVMKEADAQLLNRNDVDTCNELCSHIKTDIDLLKTQWRGVASNLKS